MLDDRLHPEVQGYLHFGPIPLGLFGCSPEWIGAILLRCRNRIKSGHSSDEPCDSCDPIRALAVASGVFARYLDLLQHRPRHCHFRYCCGHFSASDYFRHLRYCCSLVSRVLSPAAAQFVVLPEPLDSSTLMGLVLLRWQHYHSSAFAIELAVPP